MSCCVFFFVYNPFCSVFFFFSSRRRHTRFDCDWSSDVCSSDLAIPPCRLPHPPTHEPWEWSADFAPSPREERLRLGLRLKKACERNPAREHLSQAGSEPVETGCAGPLSFSSHDVDDVAFAGGG